MTRYGQHSSTSPPASGEALGAAATAMSLTQPGVGPGALRKLEQKIGVSLFIRHPTGMELTPFGRALLAPRCRF